MEKLKIRASSKGLGDEVKNPVGAEWTISDENWKFRVFFVIKLVILLAQAQIYSYLPAFRITWERDHEAETISNAFEIFFLIDIVLKFFREFTPINELEPETDLKKCMLNYLKTKFMVDLICIIPVQKFQFKNDR